MQLMNEIANVHGGRSGDRKRVETVVETLAALRSEGESLSELAHDARNMVTALGLYCDLLEEPGVLAIPFSHYGQELRLVAAASHRLVEKLVALDAHTAPWAAVPVDSKETSKGMSLAGSPAFHGGIDLEASSKRTRNENVDWQRRWDPLPSVPIANLAAELLANRNLLSAMAGPRIALSVDTKGGARPVRLTAEDLTRLLVNLVKNAAEAMPRGGKIRISLCEPPAVGETCPAIALSVEDNGPGIPPDALGKIFTSGYTTRGKIEAESDNWPLLHHGLGLAITRAIVEAAGGRIAVANRKPRGARFEIKLPVRKGDCQPSALRS
jgi:signal transduction histidine kinase